MHAFIPSRRWLLYCLVACFVMMSSRAGEGEEKKTVSLTISFGDGVEKRFTALAWKEGLTILAALELAQEHARGIKFKSRGKNETTLLLEIDGLSNGTHDKYWVYSVNGKEGDCSCALVKLQPSDAILWKFSTYP